VPLLLVAGASIKRFFGRLSGRAAPEPAPEPVSAASPSEGEPPE
jgi:hypothetical protein